MKIRIQMRSECGWIWLEVDGEASPLRVRRLIMGNEIPIKKKDFDA